MTTPLDEQIKKDIQAILATPQNTGKKSDASNVFNHLKSRYLAADIERNYLEIIDKNSSSRNDWLLFSKQEVFKMAFSETKKHYKLILKVLTGVIFFCVLVLISEKI